MRIFTDNEIIARIESLSTFKGWRKGCYDVWIRSSADAYDRFDDRAFLYEVKADGEKPVFVMARTGTSHTGSYGLKKFHEYNHKGAAVLKSDWMVYDSHAYGLHKGRAAYRQVKGFPYFRDDNRNQRVDEIGPEYNDIIYANIHRAGVNSTVINNWSTACMVTANLTEFQKFLAALKARGYPKVTLVILKEWPKTSATVPTGNTIPPVADVQVKNGQKPHQPTVTPLPSILRLGDKGEHVKRLQQALGITADGIYGAKTKRAVQSAQRKHGLTPDGIAGPNTYKALGL
jgi:hypothetical protein